MKKFSVFLISVFILMHASAALAQGEGMGELTSEPNPQTYSFELFWPISGGRVQGEPLYFLKTLKENLRRFLIFGKAQKADYDVLLAVKRSVEAEKLLNEGKGDLANGTLDKAREKVNAANDIVQQGNDLSGVATQMNNRLDNLEIFLPWLSGRFPENAENLKQLSDSVKLLNGKI